jgi:hypothetical protein
MLAIVNSIKYFKDSIGVGKASFQDKIFYAKSNHLTMVNKSTMALMGLFQLKSKAIS